MKKVIAFLLVFAVAASMILTPAALADNTASDELKEALLAVKGKIDIPAQLSEFESNVTKYGGETYYNFDWHDTSYEKSLTVSADKNGRIISYYNHSFNVSDKRLSRISKSEVISFADAFIKKTLPEMYTDSTDTLIFDEASYSASGSLRYTFTYDRCKNSIPVKDNYVSITVCISDDDIPYVRSMSANISYDTPFAEKKSEIAGYVEKYKDAFPVELVYQDEFNPDWKAKGEPRTTTVLIYRIKDNNAGFISVETGEPVTEDKFENGKFREESSADVSMGAMNKNDALSEKELAEITAVEGLLSTKEIEKRVKALPHISFPDGVTPESSELSKNDNGEYIYNLHYTNNNDESYRYVHISANAKSGKLISFYQSTDKAANKDAALSAQQKTAAENKISEFLTSAADEFKDTKLEKSDDKNGIISYYYYRIVNGIKHASNGIDVTFDANKGIVTSYSLNFTDGEFENPSNAIGEKAAYDMLTEYSPVIKLYVKSGGSYIECAALEKTGVTLDAVTGEIKNVYNDENTSFSYTDIKGHWVEEAAVKLAEIQVGVSGEKLNPDTYITQEDFLRVLASGIYGKYYHIYSADDLYQSLIREKVISEEEKNPTAIVSREQAFVYMIRMARLEKVAALKNIYKIDYADSKLLSDGRIGYCAILSGLGVICGHGGYLRPQDSITRAETIIMLYRYLLTI